MNNLNKNNDALKCMICKEEIDTLVEPKFEISGVLSGCDIKQNVNIFLCGMCACELGNWRDI